VEERERKRLADLTGLTSGPLIAAFAYLWTQPALLALIPGVALSLKMLVAAVGGTLVPVALKTRRIDPAIASGVIITTFTDVAGLFSFLGLATLPPRFMPEPHMALGKARAA
jgi:magnesium transporter